MTSASSSQWPKTISLCATTKQTSTYKVIFSHGVVFDFDSPNSLLTHFFTKENINAHNKVEMGVYEFIIFIVCNGVTALVFICGKDNSLNFDSNKT